MKIVKVSSGDGKPNPAGHKMELFLIPIASLTSTPPNKAYDADAPGDDMEMDGDFGYIDNDVVWTKIPIVVDSAELANNLVGEIGGHAFSNELGFFLASTLADKLSFASNFVNGYVVVGIKDRNENLRIVGRHDDPAYISELSMTQGKTVGDKAGGEYKLTAGTGKIAPIFTGDLRLEPVV